MAATQCQATVVRCIRDEGAEVDSAHSRHSGTAICRDLFNLSQEALVRAEFGETGSVGCEPSPRLLMMRTCRMDHRGNRRSARPELRQRIAKRRFICAKAPPVHGFHGYANVSLRCGDIKHARIRLPKDRQRLMQLSRIRRKAGIWHTMGMPGVLFLAISLAVGLSSPADATPHPSPPTASPAASKPSTKPLGPGDDVLVNGWGDSSVHLPANAGPRPAERVDRG